jgi:hypothetical protein
MGNHFINSLATSSQCPICKGWIFEGMVNGFRTRVDPTPLKNDPELKMRIIGRKIYQSISKTNVDLIERKAWHIKNGDPDALVFASHDCKTPTYFEPEPLFETPKSKEPQF